MVSEKQLINNNFTSSLNMNQLAFAGNIERAKILIENKSEAEIKNEIEIQDKEFRKPIHWCCLRNENDFLKWIIKVGANVNSKDIYFTTALHIAAAHGNIDACIILIKNGADINAKTVYEETPYDFALGKQKIININY